MNAADSEAGSHSQEVFALNATKIEMRYSPANGTPLSTAYDQELAKLK